MADRLLGAFPSEAHRGDLDRKKARLPDDTEFYGLINEELSDPVSFFTTKRLFLQTKEFGGFLKL